MTDRILELTEKIYNEGVVKAKAQAGQIVEEAKKEASLILELAKQKEEEIINLAKLKAEEIKKNTDSEIQLASKQFISNLKQQITNLITTTPIEKPVKEVFRDIDFVKQIIQTLIQNWNPQNPEEQELSVLLPKEQEKMFIGFTEAKIHEIFNREIQIQWDPNLKNGFIIGPKNGKYRISFTDHDFENYFKKYLKERTKNMLFKPE